MNGFQSLTELKDLNLSFNCIEKIQNLPYPNKFESFSISNNLVKIIENTTFDYCLTIQRLDISRNQIKNIDFIMKLKDLMVYF